METREQTIAYFSNNISIKSKIEDLINNSKSSILVCVAWFTNNDLLGLLLDKVEQGITIEVIISDSGTNSSLNFNSLIKKGGNVLIVPSKVEGGYFLHEKFAVFDEQKCICGSYNWTYNAEKNNHESIIISSDKFLPAQYASRFRILKKEYAKGYDRTLLQASSIDIMYIAEEKYKGLEEELKARIEEGLKITESLKVGVNTPKIYWNLERYGAIGTAKRLMRSGVHHIQSGFLKMVEAGRIDLTFESIITDSKFKMLFDNETVKIAESRLRTHS